ncbi:MAG: DUF4363 family protein [Eubacteriales bacterium]
MKTFIITLSLLAVLVGFVFVNAHLVVRQISETATAVAALPLPEKPEDPARADLSGQGEQVRGIHQSWQEKLRYISLTVNHHDLMQVQDQFAALMGACEAGNYTDYILTLSMLQSGLSHLREQSLCSLGNIF